MISVATQKMIKSFSTLTNLTENEVYLILVSKDILTADGKPTKKAFAKGYVNNELFFDDNTIMPIINNPDKILEN